MRVLYVNVLPYGAHPGIDALAHGLDHRLRQAGIELRTLTTDVRSPDWVEKQTAAIQRGIDARVDGIVVYVLDPTQPAQAVAAARQRGIPVFTLERPRYPVNASLVYPNFNHGVFMAEYLASLLPPQAERCSDRWPGGDRRHRTSAWYRPWSATQWSQTRQRSPRGPAPQPGGCSREVVERRLVECWRTSPIWTG